MELKKKESLLRAGSGIEDTLRGPREPKKARCCLIKRGILWFRKTKELLAEIMSDKKMLEA